MDEVSLGRQLQRWSLLKSRIIQLSIAAETEQFTQDPAAFLAARPNSLIARSIEVTLACPLLDADPAGRNSLRTLLLAMPTLAESIRASMRADVSRSFCNLLAGVWSFVIQTELERQHPEKLADSYMSWMFEVEKNLQQEATAASASGDGLREDDEDREADAYASFSEEEVDIEREKVHEEEEDQEEQYVNPVHREPIALVERVPHFRRQRLKAWFTMVGADLDQKGINHLFTVIGNCSDMNDLPSPYKDVLQALKKMTAPGLPALMEDANKRNKLRSLYDKLPRGLIIGLFRLTNPFAIVSGLLRLLLMRPFGSKTLLQRIMVILTDVSRTEKELKLATEEVPSDVRSCLISHLNALRQQPDRGSDEFVTVSDVQEALQKAPQKTRDRVHTQEQLLACVRWMSLHARYQEKSDFIELMGSSTIIDALRHIIPIVQKPLMEIYAAGDLAELLKMSFKLLKITVDIGDKVDVAYDVRLAMYRNALDRIHQMCYSFIHKIAQKDKGALHSLLSWSYKMWRTVEQSTTIDDVFNSLSAEEQAIVWQYIDQLARVYQKGLSSSQLPTPPVIQKLANLCTF